MATTMQTLQLQFAHPNRASSLHFLLSSRRTTVAIPRRPHSGRFVVRASALPMREMDPKKRVVITGMGVVSVFGNDVDVFYEKLLAGESGVKLIDRFDASEFPARIAGQIGGFSSAGYIEPKDDKRLDDGLRYTIVSGKKALENAGLTGDHFDKINKERAGILIGTVIAGPTVYSEVVQTLTERGPKKITPFFIPHTIANMAPAKLGIDLGFMGPNYSISTVCASSNYCLHAAANHIRQGEVDLMLAGGAEAGVVPVVLGGFGVCGVLSQRNDDPKTASRPWDKDRDGFVMGEGAAVLVMESLEHAMKRDAPIFAEYLGSWVNCDAYRMMNSREDGLVVSDCIGKALEDAGVAPEESMIGHPLGAAGALEAVATVKAITTGWLHPTINQFNTEAAIEFDIVPNTKKQHEVNVAISNACGFGGYNSVVVFVPFKP